MENLRNQVAAQRIVLLAKKHNFEKAEAERIEAWEKTRELEKPYSKEFIQYFGDVGYCYDHNKKKRSLYECYFWYRMYVTLDCMQKTIEQIKNEFEAEKEAFAAQIKYNELPETNEFYESDY